MESSFYLEIIVIIIFIIFMALCCFFFTTNFFLYKLDIENKEQEFLLLGR